MSGFFPFSGGLGIGIGPTFGQYAGPGGITPVNYAALWSFGPYGTLNPTAAWPTVPTNLLVDSQDMTGAGWTLQNISGNASVDSPTQITFGANGGDGIRQSIPTVEGRNYTLFFTASSASADKRIRFWHENSATGNTAAQEITATATDYAITVLGRTGGGNVKFGFLNTAAGVAKISTVTRFAVIPGTHTASEAAAIYERVGADRQEIYDWSGKGNHLQVGSAAGADTNDPASLVESYNQGIPGTTEDLQHASWTLTDASAGSATVFTPSALDGQIVQSFTGVSGSVYIISATIASAGNTSLEWTLDGVETAVEVTGSEVRYSIEYTGDGGAANIGLRDPNAAGFGAITFTEFQIERSPTGSDALPYISSAEPVFVGAHVDYDGVDNFSEVDPLALDSDWAFYAALRADDVTSVGLFRNGVTTPNVSLDASSKVSYAGGSTVAATNAVTAGLWHLISIIKVGNTITHYLDGVANGSGTSSSGNAFAKIKIGHDGSAYLDGAVPFFAVDDSGHTASKVLSTTCDIAQQMWDERKIAVHGALANCPTLSFD